MGMRLAVGYLDSQVQAPTKSFPTSVKSFPNSEVDHFPALVRMFRTRYMASNTLPRYVASIPHTSMILITDASG